MLEITVITISDRAFRGEYEDLSGSAIETLLTESDVECNVHREIVPDEEGAILSALKSVKDGDYIITTGGTGISPRDITPDVTKGFCEKALPGISEMLRAESLKETPFAIFSRAYAGIKGDTIVINLPGSVKAVTLCINLLLPVLTHGRKMILGGGH